MMGRVMSRLELQELEAYREQLEADVRKLVDKYLTIAEWDLPDIAVPLSMRLSIAAIRRTLDEVELVLPNLPPA